MLPIRQMYVQSTRTMPYGVQGYHVQKKYVDKKPDEQASKIKKKQLKRGSYLQDYNKIHKSIPGPGVYNYAKNLWPQKNKLPRNKPIFKKTFIDEIVQQQKKQKKPAPGQYKIQKSLKQQQQLVKMMSKRKVSHPDRLTYLDGIQFQATQTPGVGKYNTRQRPVSSKSRCRKWDKPQQWRKKHENQSKKKPSKTPNMTTYNPKQVKSYQRKPTKQGQWSKLQRFQDQKGGSGLGPGKYSIIQDWAHQNGVVTKQRPKSAYYN